MLFSIVDAPWHGWGGQGLRAGSWCSVWSGRGGGATCTGPSVVLTDAGLASPRSGSAGSHAPLASKQANRSSGAGFSVLTAGYKL